MEKGELFFIAGRGFGKSITSLIYIYAELGIDVRYDDETGRFYILEEENDEDLQDDKE